MDKAENRSREREPCCAVIVVRCCPPPTLSRARLRTTGTARVADGLQAATGCALVSHGLSVGPRAGLAEEEDLCRCLWSRRPAPMCSLCRE